MKTLLNLLQSISPAEMNEARVAVHIHHKEEMLSSQLGEARVRIGDFYPVFGQMFDTGSLVSEPDEKVAGFQAGGEWLAFVAELRDIDDLIDALASITPEETCDAREYFISREPTAFWDFVAKAATRHEWLLPALALKPEYDEAGYGLEHFCIIYIFAVIIRVAEARETSKNP